MDDFVVYFAFGCSALAFGWYVVRVRWWAHLVGWTQTPLLACLVQALLPSALHRAFGLSLADHGFAVYYRATLVEIGLALLWWLWVARRVQRQGRASRGRRS
jgi:hypothetical protein